MMTVVMMMLTTMMVMMVTGGNGDGRVWRFAGTEPQPHTTHKIVPAAGRRLHHAVFIAGIVGLHGMDDHHGHTTHHH